MRHEIDVLLPWLALRDEPAAVASDAPRASSGSTRSRRVSRALARRARPVGGRTARDAESSLPSSRRSAQRLREALQRCRGARQDADRRAARPRRARGRRGARDGLPPPLRPRTEALSHRLQRHAGPARRHHYDLLASEARLASYLAIVKGDVPESHWYALGRPMTQVSGRPAALVLGRDDVRVPHAGAPDAQPRGDALAQTCELVVDAQIAYGEEDGRAVGHLRVGLRARRRAPDATSTGPSAYPASASSAASRTTWSSRRTHRSSPCRSGRAPCSTTSGDSRRWGCSGRTDCSRPSTCAPSALLDGRPFTVVRSYMAHHQGMLLVALDNLLNDQVMVDRFHSRHGESRRASSCSTSAPPRPRRANGRSPSTRRAPQRADSATSVAAPRPLVAAQAQGRPQAFVLGNGRLSSLLDRLGWRRPAVERAWRSRATSPTSSATATDCGSTCGTKRRGRVWLATSERGRTTYAVHKAEFHQRDEGISVHVDVAVAPADDVEVRQVTLHNETDRTRYLAVTSAGEPVLLPTRQAAAHPAFARMFVESESVRRPRRPRLRAPAAKSATDDRAVLVHRLVREGVRRDLRRLRDRPRGVLRARREPARPEVAGCRRGRAAPRPRRGRARSHHEPDGESRAQAQADGDARLRHDRRPVRAATALELARRYGSMHAVRWAFRDAEQESRRRLARAQLEPELLPAVQRLFSALLFADPTLRAPPDVHRRRASVQASPLGTRDLRRRPDPPRARARRAGAAPARGHRRAALPSIVRRASRSRPRRRAGLRLPHRRRRERCGASSPRTTSSDWLNRHGGIFVLAADQLAGRRAPAPRGERARRARHARRLPRVTHGEARRGPAEAPALRADARRTTASRRAPQRPELLFDNGIGGFTEDGREYVIARPARQSDAGAVVQRPGEPGVRLPGERVVARLHVVAQRGREPAHAVEKRPGLRHARRGPVPAGRRDRGGLVADAAARGRRRRDARAPRRGIHDLRARESRSRAGADRLRSARRAAQGGAGCG